MDYKKIRKLRKFLDLTQADVCLRTGISGGHLSRIERGELEPKKRNDQIALNKYIKWMENQVRRHCPEIDLSKI